MEIAKLDSQSIDNIKMLESKLRTENGENVVLVAYKA
jgi:hypothetical protein